MKKGELNEKQEIFCQNYALHGNASGSAKEAGYSSKSAKVTGHKLLQMPKVLERIEELQREMTTSYDVVAELSLMDEAEALGSQAVVMANQYK